MKFQWWKYPSQLIKHFHLSPRDAWSMTLTEYMNLLKCDDDSPQVDESKMNQEYIEQLERRHEENKRKRQEKGIVAKPEEFITNG